jgi:hypothetical protein
MWWEKKRGTSSQTKGRLLLLNLSCSTAHIEAKLLGLVPTVSYNVSRQCQHVLELIRYYECPTVCIIRSHLQSSYSTQPREIQLTAQQPSSCLLVTIPRYCCSCCIRRHQLRDFLSSSPEDWIFESRLSCATAVLVQKPVIIYSWEKKDNSVHMQAISRVIFQKKLHKNFNQVVV